MHYRTLGHTGIQVSAYALGAMMFGAAIGNPDHFVDTADRYSAGESEEVVGKALKGRRDDVVLATKVNGPMSRRPTSPRTCRRRSSGPGYRVGPRPIAPLPRSR